MRIIRSKSVYLRSWDDSLFVDFEHKLMNLSRSGKYSTQHNTMLHYTGGGL